LGYSVLVPSDTSSRSKRNRRIIIGTFIHTYRWGSQIRGDERGYIEKARAYGKLGIQVFSLEREPSLQEGMGEHVYVSLKVRYRVVPTDFGKLLLLSLFSLIAAVRKYPSRPLAVYAYNQDVENLWVAYLLKYVFGAPLVVIYHHIRAASFSPFGKGVADRLRRGFHPFSAVTKSILPALNLYAAKHADVNIALTAATRDDVERYVGIKDCAVVGNGLDTDKFRPLDLPKEYDAVFLGRLAPQKGVDVLLQAWKEVVRKAPGARLVLLGGGEKKDVLMYRRMSKELGLEGSVRFTGFVPDTEIVRYMAESKVFVFPSRKEGFAQAVSQAMGCGLCCILSDIPPLREIYGGAAVFFPLDQPVPLAEAIVRMLGADGERTVLGKKARQLALRFSWDDTVRRELGQLARYRQVRA
jgi:glycosyltransferase involved in cell wall biosynthesis